jgi:site-specific DNA-methyltransferase (adenine-specific)
VKYHSGKVEVWAGDCRDVLAGMEPDTFDAIVTDPPYHLVAKGPGQKQFASGPSQFKRANEYAKSKGFMGKAWDGGQIAHEPETWAAVLRVLKPGAHLVAFHADKNFHRLVCAIEDAGFEIRHMLLYLYGSGFPKSLDISKAIDKQAGHWRGRAGAVTIADQPAKGTEYERSNKGDPITAAAAAWDGWGTALKPSVEPICLARKPLSEPTIAANVIKWGTGAINIDGCRVGTEGATTRSHQETRKTGTGWTTGHDIIDIPMGRWPANCLHDGSDEVVSGFPEVHGAGHARDEPGGGTYDGSTGIGFKGIGVGQKGFRIGDSGSAARFFYTAKADADDRIGSKHPTVKPLDLMQWLVRLVTPPGGHVLDCFAGTGTTAEACLREGFRCTLIEREAEYLADIDRRMALAFEGDVGRSVAMAKLKPEEGDAPLLDYMAEAAE